MAEKKEKLILDVAYQPQIRTERDTRSLMLDVMLALLPAVAFAVWQYGIHPLLVILVSMASAALFEFVYRKLLKKSNTVGDLSACVTGMLLALTLPVSTPLWVPCIGTFFAIVFVKQLYGGLGKNFLNPALAGRAFLLASYTTIMGTWTIPSALAPALNADAVSMATPLSYLYSENAIPEYLSIRNLFLGFTPGCIGEVSALCLLIGGIYLIATKVISWRTPVGFIGTVAVLTLIFGHEGYSNGAWMLYNLFSGGLFLGAFFMATDYSTTPVTPNGQLVFGIGCGLLTVVIRYFGGYPEGVSYAILIMNLCSWALDKAFHRPQFGVTKEDIAAKKAELKAAKEAK